MGPERIAGCPKTVKVNKEQRRRESCVFMVFIRASMIAHAIGLKKRIICCFSVKKAYASISVLT
jgi:hypothetical protein